MTDTTEKTVRPYTLQEIEITEHTLNWKERIEQWNTPMDFDARMSWLHANLIRRGTNKGEEFLLGLRLAHGYGDPHPKGGSRAFTYSLGSGYIEIEAMKRALAAKAFRMVCNEYFHKEDFPANLCYKDPLFSQLVAFFQPYNGHGSYDNLRPQNTEYLGKNNGKHYLQVARDFAKEFTLAAWALLNGRWFKMGDSERPGQRTAQPHWLEIVELLRRTGQLEVMERGQYAPTLPIFNRLVIHVLGNENICGVGEQVKDLKWVGEQLEPIVSRGDDSRGDDLAQALYIARLHLDQDRDTRELINTRSR